MAVEVEDLYSNLNKLLADICKFLTDEGNYEKLTPYARKHADELISRSKQQLQEIAKVTIETENEYDAYVDMERNKFAESNDVEKNIIYSSVDETTVISTPPPVARVPSNPYANLPAKELCQDVKYGTLSWKYKIILRFDKTRKMYAGVHNNWLLMYSSEKDAKPLQSFNLKFHKAQQVISKQKNACLDFELISTSGEGKSYYFVALTQKDMLQWISYINRCHNSLNTSEDPQISEDEISETYDTIGEAKKEAETQEEYEEGESIYNEVDLPSPPPQKLLMPQPPDLPVRRGLKSNTPLPPIPHIETDDESTESSTTNDPRQSTVSLESKNSFSDDEEDNIYEQFITKEPTPEPPLRVVQTTNKTDYEKRLNVFNITTSKTDKPKAPLKPPILKDKPKHISSIRKQI